jgi:hypothetical protein
MRIFLWRLPAHVVIHSFDRVRIMIDACSRRGFRRLLLSTSILAFVTLACGHLAVSASPAAKDKQDVKKNYALIFGTVWNAQNRPVYGVHVKIRRADEKKARWNLVSDHHGEFAQRVPAGAADYIVWAELPKHKGPVAETKVHIENDERSDIGLHLTE